MEINKVFPDIVTKLDSSLLPSHFVGDVAAVRRMQNVVRHILDYLGEISAHEQQLGRVITTAEKLRTSNNHIIYLLKDPKNKEAGEVVGLLKIGKKHLFLYRQATIEEINPICVLDFFVKKTHQRQGYGKTLFDFMLQDQQISAERLAIDGLSENVKSFLAKHYKVTDLIKQPNNFAISSQIFGDVPASTRSLHPGATPFSSPNGRFTARRRPSTMGNVIHGDVTQPGQDGYQTANKRVD